MPACTTALGGGDRAHHHLVDAACDVLGHLRSGAVRHLDQAEAGALVEELRRERGRRRYCRRRSRARRVSIWHIPISSATVATGTGRIHRQHLRAEAAHQSDRREVARGVVGELLEGNKIDRHSRRVCEKERVAVGLCARTDWCASRPEAPGMFDHHRLAERARDAVRRSRAITSVAAPGPARHYQL